MRAIVLVALLGTAGCAHLDMPRQEIEEKILAWEALKHELIELVGASTISAARLTRDAQDWHVLALEMGAQRQQSMASSAEQARNAQHQRQISMRPPPPGMYGGGINFSHSAIALAGFKKAQVKNELANRQTDLGNALMHMSEANKQFIHAGGGYENTYILEEAYAVGIWAMNKYTGFLKERIRFMPDSTAVGQSAGRASMLLRQLYGI